MRRTVMRLPKSSRESVLLYSKFQHCFETSQQRIWTKSHRPAPNKHLTPVKKRKRTGLCQTSSPIDSRRVEESVVCDKCIMQQFVPRHMHIRRSLDMRFYTKYIAATIKHPPIQMIWGAMSCRGAGLRTAQISVQSRTCGLLGRIR